MKNQMKRLGLGTAMAVMALALLAGRSEAGMKIANGLSMHNGMKIANGLSMHNGMKIANGLSMRNGMKIANGLSMRNGMKIHNGLSTRGAAPAQIWLTNGIDPRAPLSAATKR